MIKGKDFAWLFWILPKCKQFCVLSDKITIGIAGDRFIQVRIDKRTNPTQRSCSCLTLIMACIIYWQAKEINRVLNECDPESAGIDVSLLEHISPIEWENVILYGEYVLNRDLIQV